MNRGPLKEQSVPLTIEPLSSPKMYLTFNYMFMSMWGYVHVSAGLQGGQRHQILLVRVTSGCQPLDTIARNQPQVLCKSRIRFKLLSHLSSTYFSIKNINFMCRAVCLNVCMCTRCMPCAYRDQKRALDSLQCSYRCCEPPPHGYWEPTRVLCKSYKFSFSILFW